MASQCCWGAEFCNWSFALLHGEPMQFFQPVVYMVKLPPSRCAPGYIIRTALQSVDVGLCCSTYKHIITQARCSNHLSCCWFIEICSYLFNCNWIQIEIYTSTQLIINGKDRLIIDLDRYIQFLLSFSCAVMVRSSVLLSYNFKNLAFTHIPVSATQLPLRYIASYLNVTSDGLNALQSWVSSP